MKPFNHAQASVGMWGGELEDYMPIHNFIDSSKMTYAHAKHRSIFHNEFGVETAVMIFGEFIVNSEGEKVPVRGIASEHVKQDMGGIVPNTNMWADTIKEQPWMSLRKREKVFIPF